MVAAVEAVSNLRPLVLQQQPVLRQPPPANNQLSRQQPLLLRHKAVDKDKVRHSSNSRAMVPMLRVVEAAHHGALSRR